MKVLFALLLAGVGVVALQDEDRGQAQKRTPLPTMGESGAVTYESLAKVIIELRATEKSLVRGVLTHYAGMAARYLELAAEAEGTGREYYLQKAAAEVSNIAHEGNKEVRAIRERLLEAGHRHHTDPGTGEDYIFVDVAEKNTLLVLAEKISKLTRGTPEAEIRTVLRNLIPIFEQVMVSE